jgi:photosystem II stability/assembly factor-like uncharacterized protein
MFQNITYNLISYIKGINVIIFSYLIFSSYGCRDDVATNPGPGPGPGPGPNLIDWTFQNSDILVNYTDVFFVDNKTGWIVGENNTILSTSIGGVTWPQAPANNYQGNFRSVHLINKTQGWITGDKNGVSVDGNVYISISGGAYPESQKALEFPMNTVFGLDKDFVWSGGENGQMLYSNDGGINWIESSTDVEFTIFDIHFLDQDKGYATGGDGNIIRSLDGGINWQSEYVYSDIDVHAIHFIDSATGWACGSRNTILIAKDDGSSLEWSVETIFNEPAGTTWRDIFFIDDQIGWIVGDGGAVYRSDDGGKTWVKEYTGIFSNLNAIHMVSNENGWIAGDDGIILTYTP